MKARGKNLVHVVMPVLVVCLLALTCTVYAAAATAQKSIQQKQSVTSTTSPTSIKYDPNAPPKGTITLTASSKGNVNASTVLPGSYQYIEWTCNGTYSSLVDVTLWQNNQQVGVISKGITSDQTSYKVPINMAMGNYEYRITSQDDPRIEARKPVYISCSITITKPVQNEVLSMRNNYGVTWSYVGNPAPLKLELIPTGGGSAQLIADKVPWGNSGWGQYSWQIPSNINEGNYQIQITSTGNSIMMARSQTFTLKNLGIIGIIVADPNNAPIDGATVTAIVNGTARSATTKTNGQAIFDLLPPGTYTFTATKPGYLPDGTADTKVTLASGATQSGLIKLKRGTGTIIITVKDGNNPIWGMDLDVMFPDPWSSGTTVDGTMTIIYAPAGTWPVKASAWSYNKTHDIHYAPATASVTVTPGATTTLTISMQKFGKANITVTDGTMPIYWARACTTPGTYLYCSNQSDATGMLTIELPPGGHTLQVEANGYKSGILSVNISSGGTTTGTITLTKQ
jgi:hypothetical protein